MLCGTEGAAAAAAAEPPSKVAGSVTRQAARRAARRSCSQPCKGSKPAKQLLTASHRPAGTANNQQPALSGEPSVQALSTAVHPAQQAAQRGRQQLPRRQRCQQCPVARAIAQHTPCSRRMSASSAPMRAGGQNVGEYRELAGGATQCMKSPEPTVLVRVCVENGTRGLRHANLRRRVDLRGFRLAQFGWAGTGVGEYVGCRL